MQLLSAVSKMKERKEILEIQTEHCKASRVDLYYQWKDGRIVKEEYVVKRDELIERIDVYRDDRGEIKRKFIV